MILDFRKRLADARARRKATLYDTRSELQETLEENREDRRDMLERGRSTLPPFYKRKIAYLIYVALAIQIVYSIIGLFR